MLVTRRHNHIKKNCYKILLLLIKYKPLKKIFKYSFGKTYLKKNDTLFAYPHDAKIGYVFMFDKYNG
jgi:hypothetical protein